MYGWNHRKKEKKNQRQTKKAQKYIQRIRQWQNEVPISSSTWSNFKQESNSKFAAQNSFGNPVISSRKIDLNNVLVGQYQLNGIIIIRFRVSFF